MTININNGKFTSNSYLSTLLPSGTVEDYSNAFSDLDNLFDLLVEPSSMFEDQKQPGLQINQHIVDPRFAPPPSYSKDFNLISFYPPSSSSKGRPLNPPKILIPDHSIKKSIARKEQNRIAAERCRQKKLNLINSLQQECEELKQERDKLQAELFYLKLQPFQFSPQ